MSVSLEAKYAYLSTKQLFGCPECGLVLFFPESSFPAEILSETSSTRNMSSKEKYCFICEENRVFLPLFKLAKMGQSIKQ